MIGGKIIVTRDFDVLRENFNKIEIYYFHLITLFAVTFRKFSWFKSILKLLQNIDKFVLSFLHYLRKRAWQVVIIESEPK